MPTYSIRPTIYADLLELAPLLRVGDRCEVIAAGLTPHKALWRAWRDSTISNVAFVDGDIAAIWGMAGCPLGNIGRPWLLTSPAIERIPRTFMEISRLEVARMLSMCPVLIGIVDASYWKAVRFLSFLGYSFGEPVPYGPRGVPFLPYRMER